MNDYNEGPEIQPAKRKPNHWILSLVGASIRMVFIGMGIGAAAHAITGGDNGWQYFVASATCAATYALGAVIEFAGDVFAKEHKERT